MCGIGGYINYDFSEVKWSRILNESCENLAHRGPNSKGIYYNTDEKIGLYHTRLSILDINDRSNQPFFSKDKSKILIFNGEIYNYKELKKNLQDKNIEFTTHSDTEVLLELINYFGINDALNKIDGMFSFAYYDKLKKKIFLARDRLGEKPLIYYFNNNRFLFCSEIKNNSELEDHKLDIDWKKIDYFSRFSFIASPNTIYKNYNKLEPGELLIIDTLNELKIKKTQYWSPSISYNNAQPKKKLQQVVSESEIILDKIISEQINSDVNLGSFLSGGYDSTLISFLAAKHSHKQIQTFSIGYENQMDESSHAKKISKIIQSKHESIIIKPKDISDNISKIISVYDEPFSDISQIPTFLLCQFAKKNVSVALSGDGGDEIFGGYYRYKYLNYIKFINNKFPIFFKKLILRVIDKLTENIKSAVKINIIGNKFGILGLDDKLRKCALIMANSESDNFDLYFSTLSRNDSKEFSNKSLKQKYHFLKDFEFDDFIRILDLLFYLNNDILTKVDKASMANSLEVRSPFLDRKIVEYSLENLKNNRVFFQNKVITKQILKKYINLDLLKKPKQGFSFPLQFWIYKDLKDFCCDNLNQLKSRENFLHLNKEILSMIDKINNNQAVNIYYAWSLVILNNWIEINNES